VREHGPEAVERLGGDARTELRDVPLQVGADEVVAPEEALFVGSREKAVRKAAADPQRRDVALRLGGFQDVERAELDVRDAPGEAFSRLPQQVKRRRAQDEEPAVAVTTAPAAIDETA
jgi:hypothetical protein